ncbi:MAG: DUF3046 domain-containing protein [Frankia sp.]
MRQTDFWARMRRQFGDTYAESLARDHVVSGLGGRTVHEALNRGDDPKAIWRALCEEFEVPAREH